METSNDTRNKLQKLVAMLQQQNQEVERLKALLSDSKPISSPAVYAVDAFRNILVTAHRNNAAYLKPKVTSRRLGYVDICYRNFMDFSAQELQEGELTAYKDMLRQLGFVHPASFDNGGIPARVEGKTARVVRIPQPIFDLLTEGEAARDGG